MANYDVTNLRERCEIIRNVVLFLALGALTGSHVRAHNAPAFKGHAMGETVADFLAIEARHPLIKSSVPLTLADCEAVVADPKSEKKAKSRLGYARETDLLGRCQRLLKLRDGQDGYVSPELFGVTNTGQFSGGRLVGLSIYVSLIDISYKEVRDDLQQKLGPPTQEGQTTYQNGLGAKFDFPWATWRDGKTFADLKQEEQDSVMVSIVDGEWQGKQKKEEKRPSSLD